MTASCSSPPKPSANSAASAQPTARTPAAPSPFVVVAEGDLSLKPSRLENGLLLINLQREGNPPWLLLQAGSLRQVDPDLPLDDRSEGEAPKPLAYDELGGRWGDILWRSGLRVDHSGPSPTPDCELSLKRGDGPWERRYAAKGCGFRDVWEAPRGCILGLVGGEMEPGGPDWQVLRLALDCPNDPPKALDELKLPVGAEPPARYRLLKVQGLSDGGVAAIVALGTSGLYRSFFEHSNPEITPKLAVWDRAGVSRLVALPVPSDLASADIDLDGPFEIVRDQTGAIVVAGSLSRRREGGAERRSISYVARCVKTCEQIEMPINASGLLTVLADGSILVTGDDGSKLPVIWIRQHSGSFEELGSVPHVDRAVLTHVYATGREDVWLVFGARANPSGPPHTWILHNHPASSVLRLQAGASKRTVKKGLP